MNKGIIADTFMSGCTCDLHECCSRSIVFYRSVYSAYCPCPFLWPDDSSYRFPKPPASDRWDEGVVTFCSIEDVLFVAKRESISVTSEWMDMIDRFCWLGWAVVESINFMQGVRSSAKRVFFKPPFFKHYPRSFQFRCRVFVTLWLNSVWVYAILS